MIVNTPACVPIGNGCNNFLFLLCGSLCSGARNLSSASEIISEVKSLVNKGYKKIMLIAQNVNSYHSGAYNFPKLLIKLSKISGNFWIRFSSVILKMLAMN